ncbi:hypothetical protein MKZ38_007496 [Zalerion maritima]|uniref:Uncharacterized protein n=1 Tax=Zalerion maritima TaxID=339359 RepID=A0AAD5RUS1_9PEZI|nr:hypothetical protein MKZ38_007496 [Zalerion maritima]
MRHAMQYELMQTNRTHSFNDVLDRHSKYRTMLANPLSPLSTWKHPPESHPHPSNHRYDPQPLLTPLFSTLYRQLIPLLLLLLLVAGVAWVGYQIYLSVGKIRDATSQRMENKHHVKFTKDGGLQVGVKDRTSEQYVDRTQNYVVKAWNLRSEETAGKKKK